AYEEAAAEDGEDPEPWVRIGDVRCKLDPTSKSADAALTRALRIDRTYAPAFAARARCAAARGDPGAGLAILDEVATEDRESASLEALFVRLAAETTDAGLQRRARGRAISLT